MSIFENDFKNEQIKKQRYFFYGNTFLLLFTFLAYVLHRITSGFNLVLCPMKNFFGLFCPFCGGTRCAMNFIKLNFYDSFMYHPTTFILIIYAIIVDVLFLIDIIFKKDMVKKVFRIEIVLAIYIFASVIQYLIRVYCFYNQIECPIMYTNI